MYPQLEKGLLLPMPERLNWIAATGGFDFGTAHASSLTILSVTDSNQVWVRHNIWLPGADHGQTQAGDSRLIACLLIAILYLGIVARVLIKLLDEESSFAILAAAGLVVQFGLQALINMAVNVQIAPSKGMTLPFISYGGSSMLALSIGMGLLLAFTRRNPYLTRSPYVVKWGGENIAG
jgi:hypothetical protein